MASNRFKPHPSCEELLITHLSFADDVLVFFDGSEESLRGILEILEEFKQLSGLIINKDKTELMIDGGSFSLCHDLAEAQGIKQGALPIRYLGVPLSSKKMRISDFKPLLDKVEVRFNSWTVKHLSFAGRFQLIQAVIYSTITFWTSIFILPSECISILERMCNTFLWNGAPQSARGAKVSWDIICTPKKEGGLGLRKLADWNQVLALKLIWLLFAAGGSLWVSWIKRHKIGSASFWELEPLLGDSWIWKQLCKLSSIARPFLFCEVGSGRSASFWNDDWTELGPLIHLTDARGPAVSGLHKDATVAEALMNGEWWLSASRSRNAIITVLKQWLPAPDPIVLSSSDDKYLWRTGNNFISSTFSTTKTWTTLHPPSPTVFWHSQIWFKGRIPKHAFISWLVAWNRLVTRDQMRDWGIEVSPSCLLCSVCDENRQHLFFYCDFSSEIWGYFCTRLQVTPPTDFDDCLRWLKTSSSDPNILLIVKLLFQAIVYVVWKERNVRLHSSVSRSAQSVILEVKQVVRSRLDPLSRDMRPPSSSSLTF